MVDGIFHNYVGQIHIKNLLQILLTTAQVQKINLAHILISGPSGYGKTTLAQLIGRALKVKTQIVNGNLLQTPAQIISLLSHLKSRQVLFIDEIHAISQRVAEILYPVMSEGRMSVILGKGYHAKVVNLQLPVFTLVGATTLVHQLPRPFQNRFTHVLTMAPYQIAEIKALVQQTLLKFKLPVVPEVVDLLADRSRLNPRTVIQLVTTFRSFLTVKGPKVALAVTHLDQFLIMIGIYPAGVNQLEMNYLSLIYQQHPQAISLTSLAQMINYSERAITLDIEPFLIKIGLIIKTNRGRQITTKGVKFIQAVKLSTNSNFLN